MKLSMSSNEGRQSDLLVCCCSLGIGYEVAKWLAMIGARVILACRSKDKAMEVCNMDFMKKLIP